MSADKLNRPTTLIICQSKHVSKMKTTIKSGKIANIKVLIGMLLTICFLSSFVINQKEIVQANSNENQEKVYEKVEQLPEFPGGQIELQKFLATSIKYPEAAIKNKIQGKVFVNFVVGKDGVVKEAKIARGVDPLLDAEALRVVNSFPKWKPGMEKGEKVAVVFTIPIKFALK
jgi:periplasmic protein TonB